MQAPLVIMSKEGVNELKILSNRLFLVWHDIPLFMWCFRIFTFKLCPGMLVSPNSNFGACSCAIVVTPGCIKDLEKFWFPVSGSFHKLFRYYFVLMYTFFDSLFQIWVYGNSFESFLVAVVNPNKQALESWAEQNGINKDFNSLCDDSGAKSYILGELTKIGKEKKVLFRCSSPLIFLSRY